jgi:hypothetical protein
VSKIVVVLRGIIDTKQSKAEEMTNGCILAEAKPGHTVACVGQVGQLTGSGSGSESVTRDDRVDHVSLLFTLVEL